MNEEDLIRSLEKVGDRASFIAFTRSLISNRTHFIVKDAELSEKTSWSSVNDWANDTIENFLDSALACMEDHGDDGLFSMEPTWRTFAEFLYGGKIYE